MDKNTLKMMIVMAVVVFGFMLINKPQPKAVSSTDDGSAVEVIDETFQPINLSQEQLLLDAKNILKQAGTVDNSETGSPLYSYSESSIDIQLNDGTNLSDGAVNLTLEGDTILGTITFADQTLTYAEVVNSQFPETFTDLQKSEFAKTLRAALTNASAYKSLAQYRTAPSMAYADSLLTLENGLITLNLSAKGGFISKATLKNYFTYFPSEENPDSIAKKEVVMFDNAVDGTKYSFVIPTAELNISTDDLYFTPERIDDNTILMSLNLGNDSFWGIKYSLQEDSYLVHIEIVQNNPSAIIPKSTSALGFNWDMNMPRQERGRTFEERNSQIMYQYPGEKPDDINGMKSGSAKLDNSANWVAFRNQFFCNVLISNNNQFHAGGTLAQEKLSNNQLVKHMAANLNVDYNVNDDKAAEFDMFIGPNLYPLLGQIDDQLSADGKSLYLNRIVPLGWSWLRWINTLIVIPVFNFLSGFISSYGIIILLLTLFIKLILFPLTYKSLMSQAKMRLLAPQIKEINEKYPGKENAMVRQQKTMALYGKAGASPFAGCLPMLLQMPILIAMFSFFPSAIELRGQSFLWCDNLAAPDSVLTLPFSIPFYGDHVSLFCLLMTITNIIYTRINMQSQPTSQGMPGMKWMMYMMPVMFLFFFNDYAAALSYYYFLSLLITIAQTYIFRRVVKEDKLRARMAANAEKNKGKKSGFMARLAEAQRQQQEKMRQQQNNRRR